MTMKRKPSKRARAGSYEGDPAKLLGAILPRIKRRESELDAIAERLRKRKDQDHAHRED